MITSVLAPRACHLGEGAFWHPLRRQFFWFDIVNGHLLSQDRTGPRLWKFPEIGQRAVGRKADRVRDRDAGEQQAQLALEKAIDRAGAFAIGRCLGHGADPEPALPVGAAVV